MSNTIINLDSKRKGPQISIIRFTNEVSKGYKRVMNIYKAEKPGLFEPEEAF